MWNLTMNYSRIYNDLISAAQHRAVEYHSAKHHIHHILPRCCGGDNNKTNLVVLTFREHFIAHLLLHKMYPNNNKLTFALHCMFTRHGFKHTSKSYSWAIANVRRAIGSTNSGQVSARDEQGNKVRVTSEQYKANNQLSFHTSGMVAARDDDGKSYWITSDEYKQRSDLTACVHDVLYNFTDVVTGKPVKATKQHARQVNKIYRRFCSDTKIPIIKKRFKQTVHQHSKPDPLWLSDPLYRRKQGEVVVWDNIQSTFRVVSSEQFKSDPTLSGTTANLATVFDPTTNAYIKVGTDDERIGNSLRGPNVGKVNVICRLTGIKQQKRIEELTDDDVATSTPSLNFRITPKYSIHYLEWKYGVCDRSLLLFSDEQLVTMERAVTNLPSIKQQRLDKLNRVKPTTKTQRVLDCFERGMTPADVIATMDDVSVVMVRRTFTRYNKETKDQI